MCKERHGTSTWAFVPPLKDTRQTKQMPRSSQVLPISRGATQTMFDWKSPKEDEREACWKVDEAGWTGVVCFKVVTVIPPEEASMI